MKQGKFILSALAVITGIGVATAHSSQRAHVNPYKKVGTNYVKIINYNPAFCNGDPATCYFDLPTSVTTTITPTTAVTPTSSGGTLSYTGLLAQ